MIKDPKSADLFWRDGTLPVSALYGDIYYNDDGVAESDYVFLQGIDAEGLFSSRDLVTLGEIGFGMGVNFLTTMRCWRNHRRSGSRLHYVAIEAHPPRVEDLCRALSRFPCLNAEARKLTNRWKIMRYGVHRFGFDDILLTLIVMPAPQAMRCLDCDDGFAFDAWFLDGFSPACNPELWERPLLKKIADLTMQGGRVASFTATGRVRRCLEEVGFRVERRPGFAQKRHALAGRKAGKLPVVIKPKSVVDIIGAGIAGQSTAFALRHLDHKIRIFDVQRKGVGSLQKAVMVHPRPGLKRNSAALLFFHAWVNARVFYQDFSDALLPWRGVKRVATSQPMEERFQKLYDQGVLAQYGAVYEKDENGSSLFFPDAFGLKPAKLFELMQKYHPLEIKKELPPFDKTDKTVIAAGIESSTFFDHVPLWGSWGHYSLIHTETLLETAFSGAICAFPLEEKTTICIGASHQKWLTGFSAQADLLSEQHHQQNLSRLNNFISSIEKPHLLAQQVGNQAGIRAISSDRIPIAGAVDNQHYILTGLSGHGFLSAPLLGEILAGQIMHCPFPAAGLTKLITPQRFFRRKNPPLFPKGFSVEYQP